MNVFSVHRSPLRQFMFGLAGLILILAAIDIVWAHKLAEPPTIDAAGNLTGWSIDAIRARIEWLGGDRPDDLPWWRRLWR